MKIVAQIIVNIYGGGHERGTAVRRIEQSSYFIVIRNIPELEQNFDALTPPPIGLIQYKKYNKELTAYYIYIISYLYTYNNVLHSKSQHKSPFQPKNNHLKHEKFQRVFCANMEVGEGREVAVSY